MMMDRGMTEWMDDRWMGEGAARKMIEGCVNR